MPHCLVICANGLQAAYLGAYGNPWIHTPNLDRLASEGVVFDWHFPDNLTTLPTRRSWWSGRYTLHDELLGWGAVENPEQLEALRLLDASGVSTVLISDCPYLNDPAMGFTTPWRETTLIRGSGYDDWCEPRQDDPPVESEPGLRLPSQDDPTIETWKTRWENLLRNRNRTGRLENPEMTGPGQVVDAAIGWLANHAADDSPFLLWLDIFCPHGPWDLPEKFRDFYAAEGGDQFVLHETGDLLTPHLDDAPEVPALIDVPGGWVGDVVSIDELVRLRKTYAGAVSLLDDQIGRLLEEIEKLELRENLVIVFVSDQGEPLGEHEFVRRPIATVHEELAHTPLFVRWPGAAENGQRCSAIVQSVDLPATILDACGLRAPDDWPGRSLKSLLEDHEAPWRDAAIYAMDNEAFAIRTEDWLLIQEPANDDDNDPDDDSQTISTSLFAKPEDRWDIHDVSSMHEDVVEELTGRLKSSLEELRGRSADDSDDSAD